MGAWKQFFGSPLSLNCWSKRSSKHWWVTFWWMFSPSVKLPVKQYVKTIILTALLCWFWIKHSIKTPQILEQYNFFIVAITLTLFNYVFFWFHNLVQKPNEWYLHIIVIYSHFEGSVYTGRSVTSCERPVKKQPVALSVRARVGPFSVGHVMGWYTGGLCRAVYCCTRVSRIWSHHRQRAVKP